MPSSVSSRSERKVWPVTFEQFVEHLDAQDRFVKNLAELLVSVSCKGSGIMVHMRMDVILRLLYLTIGNGPKCYSKISRRFCAY